MSRERRERQEYDIPSAKDWAKQHESQGRTALRVPDGTSMFQIRKAGNYRLDFIPFVVGEGNLDAAKGKAFWHRTYFVHRGIGPNGDTYCCPAKCTRGRLRCPICEDVSEQYRRIDPGMSDEQIKREKDRIGQLRWKERQLFCVIDRDAPDKGIQVWDQSFHLFGQALKTRLDNMDPDDKYDWFHHPVKGMTVKITATEEKLKGYSYYDCSTIDFKTREPLDMDVIDQAPCLDDMVRILSYEELSRIYLQVPEDRPEPRQGRERPRTNGHDEDAPRAAREAPRDEDAPPARPAKTASFRTGEVVMYGKIECEVVKVSQDGASFTLEDDDGQRYHAVGVSEIRALPSPGKAPVKEPMKAADDDDDDDAPPPAKGLGRRRVDDDDDAPPQRTTSRVADDDDDIPAPKKRK